MSFYDITTTPLQFNKMRFTNYIELKNIVLILCESIHMNTRNLSPILDIKEKIENEKKR